MSRRIAATLSGSACAAIVALTGCSSSLPSPAAAAPTATAGSHHPVASPAATSPGVASTPSPASPGGGHLTAAISGLPSHPALAFGGAPLQFTVTVRNTTHQTYRDITPLVSIGHCTCNGTPVKTAPAGALAELDPATGHWRPVIYDTEGTGMDYILGNIVQQPALTLSPGTTASFTFRMRFSAKQDARLHNGQTAINVTVVQLPARTWIGNRPAASIPLTVLVTG